jgi:DTW domain-containing protein YfiP
LQHPQEQRHAKNSVALLRLSLAHCDVVVGERFAPDVLQAMLHRPGRDTLLLYPDVPAAPAPSAPAPAAGTPLRLVVLDATWRKSLRMLLEHPALAALPRLLLVAPEPTRYRAIRAARRADQVSTLEATVQAPTACARPPGSRPAAHHVQQPAHDAFAIGPQAVVGVLVGDPGLQPAHAQRGVLGQ